METNEIVKEVFDETKMPKEIAEGNDPFQKESWISDEKGRIEQDYENKLAGIKPGESETEEEKAAKLEKEKTTAFSFDDFKEYGDFKTVDEIKLQLKAAKEGGASKAEIDAIKTELAETKSKLEAKPKTFFNNAELAKLDKLSKEKPEDYERLARLKWGNTDAMTVLKEKFIKDNPEYKDSDIVEDMIKRKYGLDQEFDPEVPEDVKKQKMANAELQIAAKSARKELLSELDNITLPETEFVDEKKLKEVDDNLKTQLRTEWSDFAKGIEKEFQKFKIQIPQKDERGNIIKDKFIDFTEHVIPDDIRKMCADYAHEYVVENRMKPTKENIQAASLDMMKTYVFANLPFIIDTAIEKRATMDVDEFRKQYNNPSGGKNKEVKGAVAESQAKADMKKAEEDYIKGR